MRTKLAFAAVAAAALLAVGTASAAASLLSVDHRDFRIVWAEMTITMGVEAVRCRVTLEGTLHSSTIRKTNGALIGHITRAIPANPCAAGALTLLQESLPWHVTYESFNGTLPNPTAVAVRIIGMAMRVDPPGATPACLGTTTAERPAVIGLIINERRLISSAIWDESRVIPTTTGLFCGMASVTLSGAGAVMRLGTTNADISLTLIN